MNQLKLSHTDSLQVQTGYLQSAGCSTNTEAFFLQFSSDFGNNKSQNAKRTKMKF